MVLNIGNKFSIFLYLFIFLSVFTTLSFSYFITPGEPLAGTSDFIVKDSNNVCSYFAVVTEEYPNYYVNLFESSLSYTGSKTQLDKYSLKNISLPFTFDDAYFSPNSLKLSAISLDFNQQSFNCNKSVLVITLSYYNRTSNKHMCYVGVLNVQTKDYFYRTYEDCMLILPIKFKGYSDNYNIDFRSDFNLIILNITHIVFVTSTISGDSYSFLTSFFNNLDTHNIPSNIILNIINLDDIFKIHSSPISNLLEHASEIHSSGGLSSFLVGLFKESINTGSNEINYYYYGYIDLRPYLIIPFYYFFAYFMGFGPELHAGIIPINGTLLFRTKYFYLNFYNTRLLQIPISHFTLYIPNPHINITESQWIIGPQFTLIFNRPLPFVSTTPVNISRDYKLVESYPNPIDIIPGFIYIQEGQVYTLGGFIFYNKRYDYSTSDLFSYSVGVAGPSFYTETPTFSHLGVNIPSYIGYSHNLVLISNIPPHIYADIFLPDLIYVPSYPNSYSDISLYSVSSLPSSIYHFDISPGNIIDIAKLLNSNIINNPDYSFDDDLVFTYVIDEELFNGYIIAGIHQSDKNFYIYFLNKNANNEATCLKKYVFNSGIPSDTFVSGINYYVISYDYFFNVYTSPSFGFLLLPIYLVAVANYYYQGNSNSIIFIFNITNPSQSISLVSKIDLSKYVTGDFLHIRKVLPVISSDSHLSYYPILFFEVSAFPIEYLCYYDFENNKFACNDIKSSCSGIGHSIYWIDNATSLSNNKFSIYLYSLNVDPSYDDIYIKVFKVTIDRTTGYIVDCSLLDSIYNISNLISTNYPPSIFNPVKFMNNEIFIFGNTVGFIESSSSPYPMLSKTSLYNFLNYLNMFYNDIITGNPNYLVFIPVEIMYTPSAIPIFFGSLSNQHLSLAYPIDMSNVITCRVSNSGPISCEFLLNVEDKALYIYLIDKSNFGFFSSLSRILLLPITMRMLSYLSGPRYSKVGNNYETTLYRYDHKFINIYKIVDPVLGNYNSVFIGLLKGSCFVSLSISCYIEPDSIVIW